MSIASFMQRVSMEVREARRLALENVKGTTWSFRDGLALIPNMEVQCPGCKHWFATGQVWLVDKAENWVRGVWKLNGHRLPLHEVHPHVDGGLICVGTSKDAVQALTMGINPESYYYNVYRYLRGLGDDCELSQRDVCYWCGEAYPMAELVEQPRGLWCQPCIERERRRNEEAEEEPEESDGYPCVNCDNEVENDGDYCSRCCCESCVNERRAELLEERKASELSEEDE